MKRFLPYSLLLLIGGALALPVRSQEVLYVCPVCGTEHFTDSIEPDTLVVSDPVLLFNAMPNPVVNYNMMNLSFSPKVFAGYRKLHTTPDFMNLKPYYGGEVMTYIEEVDEDGEIEEMLEYDETPDTIPMPPLIEILEMQQPSEPNLLIEHTPKWLNDALLSARAQKDLLYSYMIENPFAIEHAYWDLPEPPVLIADDPSFVAFLNKQEVPEIKKEDAVLPDKEVKKIHWLHTFNTGIQFSQAFVSPNWYQGGNSNLALLFNFNWNVTLNQVYHPNLLFQSDLSYKLSMTSNPSGYLHKYTISEDNFQYNLNTGLKAIKDWYYSLNLMFKTQIFNNFEPNSHVRKASFLSPGDLNLGLGMSYNHKNKLNTFQYTLTISPLSYNLKTCISDKVNHATYNIPLDKKYKNEIGSNIEFNMDWKITANISYKTRVFTFTDYHYFLGDWQNTLSFDINRFLSTQIFVHLRYDGSVESETSWKKFMMREILSFGLSYTFSTKPK